MYLITSIKRSIAALVLLAGIAQGQTLLTVTNARIDVANDPAFTLSGPVGSYRITYTVTAGGTPIDLDDGSTFRLEVWAADNFRLHNLTNTTGTEISPGLGQTRFILPSLIAGQYRLRGIATPVSGDTNASWNLSHHYLTVTNSTASSGSTTVNLTNNISVNATSTVSLTTITTNITTVVVTTGVSVAESGSGSVITGLTASGSALTAYRGAGGGSSLSVYDSTNGLLSAAVTSILFNSQFTLTGSNAVSVSLLSIPDGYIGTNRATYSYTGGDQTFTVPAGISNVTFWLWGGGGSGSTAANNGVGGYTFCVIGVTAGQQFKLVVGQGGLSQLSISGYGSAAYGGGGRGYTTNLGAYVFSGAGASYVVRIADTQLVAAAGGAGAMVDNASGSWTSPSVGGGIYGYGVGASTATNISWPRSGAAGTQDEGGAAGWVTNGAGAIVVATAGSYLQGGDGAAVTNHNVSGPGGGGGYYGGGGSIRAGTGSIVTFAGGGSGYVWSGCVAGETLRPNIQASPVPLGTELPFYGAGVATRGVANGAGANGQITVGY